jgi:hypothetical protein
MITDKADWKSRLCLAVGQGGTAKLYEQYGNALFCVRYRYNRKKKLRIKTVELVVDTAKWVPKEKA